MSATPDFLEPRPDLAVQVPAVRVDDTFDDTLDRDAEISAYAELPLAACRTIATAFRSLDGLALTYQLWHKRVTRVAALTGTLAVIMAILGLALKGNGAPAALMRWVSGSEIVFALSALAFAAIGLSIALKDRWLFYRHQAELCRLLKFRFLLQPGRWGNHDAAHAWIEHALDQIRALKVKHSVEEAIEAAFPRFSSRPEDVILPRATILQLCNYYRSKRLGLQRAYLENRAGQNAAKMLLYSRLPTYLFFLSVLAAVAHYLLETKKLESGVLFAGLAAACLPVAATWARTIRAAFEHSRNKSRFRAASAALADLERCLQEDIATGLLPARAASQPGLVDARAPLQDMLWCEQILHTEHIEWLRLMVETEWYG